MRVLHVVMNLDYGGVESYVVRVSKAMAKMGHQVTVLSQGGPVEDLLHECGIDVIRASFTPENMPALSRQVAERGFDVINGHNYNSGRVAHIISQNTGIPYVLTVHGPRHFLKRVFYKSWSRRVIALSGADMRGIAGMLGIPRDHISRSFIPIDPAQSGDAKCDLHSDFSLPSDTKLILHVSRFTNRKARVALELIKAMPDIMQRVPEARLLIIGGGPAYDRIVESAATFNKQYGQIISVQPSRLDVSRLFKLADIAVATATTAMEILAHGTPLVAAGRTGFVGLVEPDNFDMAYDLLFGDHGKCPRQTHSGLLSTSVLSVLQNKTQWKVKADIVADRVRREFTPAKAAESLLAIYRDVINGR
ncbi:MAG: glycosyltransferase family 4 protein [Armatimonadota bacterium]